MPTRAHALRLSLFYGMLFLAIGISLPYWPVWLQDRGMGPEQIGILLAASYFARTLASAGIGALVDRLGDRRRPMILLAAASLGLYALFLLAHGFWPLLLLTILVAITFTTLTPLGDSLTMLHAADLGLDYGRIRLWGSLAFIVAATLGGLVLERSTSDALLWLILLSLLGLVGGCIALPHSRAEPRPVDRSQHPDAPPSLRRLLVHPVFLLFLAATSLVHVSHMLYYGFATLHWQRAGLSGDIIGLLWAEGVVAEIILFACSGPVLRRLSPGSLILLAAGAAVLRWTVFGLTTSPWLLALVQGLHAFTFGACHLGAMHLIARAVPRALSAGAQGLYAAVATGLGPGVALLVAGPLYSALDGAAFFVAAVMALAGSVLAVLLQRRWRGNQLSLPSPSLSGRARASRAGTGRECPARPGAPRC